MKKRTLVIGDIHGAYRALLQVLEKAAVTYHDTLVFLGDYVDGWSESAEVIDLLLKLEQTNTCIFIRGNHDTWCEEWLRTGKADPTWLIHGGASTVQSYSAIGPAKKESHLSLFGRLMDYFNDEHNNLFVHAGFSSMHGPEKEPSRSNFSWDRTLWEMVLSMDQQLVPGDLFYPRRLQHFREIFIGHTPTTNYGLDKPVNAANVWNMDTGAAFSGKLSLMDINTRTLWQSEPVHSLYPGESGRNKI
jgi:serine/threonine protein phosphatase 1